MEKKIAVALEQHEAYLLGGSWNALNTKQAHQDLKVIYNEELSFRGSQTLS